MKPRTLPILSHALVALTLSLASGVTAQAAPVVLNPLTVSPNVPIKSGGLAGNWYKADNNARFSNLQYTERDTTSPTFGQTGAIKNWSWATGIWAASDVANLASSPRPSYVTRVATSVGAINYANNVYNNIYSPATGNSAWNADYDRPLTPIVGGANNCDASTMGLDICANEQNYAATFTGYLYVATKGKYDFSVFADDGFTFALTGLDGVTGQKESLGIDHNALVNSSGRGQYDLLAQNGFDSLTLDVGYYGIGLNYFNRLEAGVLDLAWHGPGNIDWRTIDGGDLFNSVPEPTSVALWGMALLALVLTRMKSKHPSARWVMAHLPSGAYPGSRRSMFVAQRV